jgi:hypothetical protein
MHKKLSASQWQQGSASAFFPSVLRTSVASVPVENQWNGSGKLVGQGKN